MVNIKVKEMTLQRDEKNQSKEHPYSCNIGKYVQIINSEDWKGM